MLITSPGSAAARRPCCCRQAILTAPVLYSAGENFAKSFESVQNEM